MIARIRKWWRRRERERQARQYDGFALEYGTRAFLSPEGSTQELYWQVMAQTARDKAAQLRGAA